MDSDLRDGNLGDEVAIVGAGLAGLVCARQLHRQGIQTILVEKSRGLGGRMATRRRDRVCFDHGLPSLVLANTPSASQGLIQELLAQGIIQPGLTSWAHWQPDRGIDQQSTKNGYVAPEGMTAIAKYLAQDLDIRREWLLQTLVPGKNKSWQLVNDRGESLQAKTVVMTVPAPQALAILTRSGIEQFSQDLISQLRSITYEPSLVVMAGYAPEATEKLNFPWQVLEFSQHSTLSKIILDSSKRSDPDYPIYILQSSPDFAHQYDLASDLSDAASIMLQQAAQLLHPLFSKPEWSQVHRWRYALPQSSLESAFVFTEQPLPLFLGGDGYGASQNSNLNSSQQPIEQPTEQAIFSGLSMAIAIATAAPF